MPQLSLYIDENTLRKIEAAARIENLSVSKYVVRKLNEALSTSWPSNYEKLFGAIDDDCFQVEPPTDFSQDAQRETL